MRGGILYSLPQKLSAEFVGTFAVVFIAAGSRCTDPYLRGAGQPGAGLLAQALAYGLATAAMVTALAHISGGHLNPAVTAGFWVTKRLDTLHAVLYCLTQLLGAVAAAYALRVLLPEAIWRPTAIGSSDLASDFTRMQGMALESTATFFVVFVFFAAASEDWDSLQKFGGLAVGLAVAMGALVAQPFTGASMNPARSFGPAVAARHWINHAVYWVGPLLGGILAAVVYDRLFVEEDPPRL